MRLLDAFCGAGGAGMGYHRAGFEIVGVDIDPQPNYPFEFIQAEALEYIEQHSEAFDVIHTSPPCQAYTSLWDLHKKDHPDLIDETRKILINSNKPYVIENVPGAPLINPLMLCGTMFGLDVIRHRLFEIQPAIYFAPRSCNHYKSVVKIGRPIDLSKQFHSVAGHFSGVKEAQIAMDINWMGQKELSQAIPPAYTEYIGKELIRLLEPEHA